MKLVGFKPELVWVSTGLIPYTILVPSLKLAKQGYFPKFRRDLHEPAEDAELWTIEQK